MPDVEVNNSGSIVLLRPMTARAEDWMEDNIPDDAMWFGGALAVEWRYADDIIDGMSADGLAVQ